MNDIILYTSTDGKTRLDLRVEGQTVWLTQLEIAELFQTTKNNVSIHTKNIFDEGELSPEATVKESLTVQIEGKREVKRSIQFYNLDLTRQSAKAHVYKVVPMTKAEKEERLKSGNLKVGNRVGWAMSHLTKAKLIEKIEKATYQATEAGHSFLKEHEGQEITCHDLRKIEGYEEAWKSASQKRQKGKASKDDADVADSDNTPEESIERAVEEVESNLRSELLEQLTSVDPYRFERIVLDLLFAMGYGGSREEAAQVTKKSNDEGIDGVINEDRLGLDVIYVQAKRWKENVGRQAIQNFVGALAGQQANKGVFITTSDFRSSAVEYARTVSQKVILINGSRLADLMIEHNIGVSTIRTIDLKRLDSDYFED